uniref:Uncharacterized protein n=2 Tax=Moniliophthora roreri TaxID=221103 RepID=A0A0W0FYW9_MONRR
MNLTNTNAKGEEDQH